MKRLLLSVCASSGSLGILAFVLYMAEKYPFATGMTFVFVLFTVCFYILFENINQIKNLEREKKRRREEVLRNILIDIEDNAPF